MSILPILPPLEEELIDERFGSTELLFPGEVLIPI